MSLFSFGFFFFCLLTITIYFLIPKKYQWIVLLIANCVFYLVSAGCFFIFILITSLVTYITAFRLETVAAKGKRDLALAQSMDQKKSIKTEITRQKKLLCGIAVCVSIGIWIVLKYGNFLIDNFNAVFSFFQINAQINALTVILPLGMSYYTFHAVGYLVDVYRGKYPAERNFAKYFTFISFFPHTLQGPFNRFDQMRSSLFDPHTFSYDRFGEGLRRILWGVSKKLLVADKFGIAVVTILSDYPKYSGTHIAFAMLLYGIQIYADFSGYMDIMCGICHILGIKMAENFQQPYFAKSIDEFWRRWHITLGKWFKDYVFYPVSMGKTAQNLGRWGRKKFNAKMGKLLPGYVALVFVWTATGLWHGANWTYLIWGYLNLLIILSSMQLGDTYEKIKAKLHINSQNKWWQVFCVLRTFMLVCFLRFFSVVDSMGTAFAIIKHALADPVFNIFAKPLTLFAKMSTHDIYIALIGSFTMLIVDLLCESNKWDHVKSSCPFLLRNLIYVILIFAIILFAGGNSDLAGDFMYANF